MAKAHLKLVTPATKKRAVKPQTSLLSHIRR
jgi:hypothetical protein